MLAAAFPRQRVRRWLVVALMLITILLGPNGLLSALPVAHAQAPAITQVHPNLFDPTQDATSVFRPDMGQSFGPAGKSQPPQQLLHTIPPPMKPGHLGLVPGQAEKFLGSDGRLEVDVPAGAITASDLTQAGGTLTLQITQIAPASGSNAGGSGLVSFGTYLLQLVDVHGMRVPHGLRAAATLKLHYGSQEGALDLAHAFVVLNAPLPAGVQVASPEVATTPTLGIFTTQNAALDSTHQTLAVSPAVIGPSTSISWNTDSPVASFGKPDPFNVDINAGSLSAGYTIDLPAGPGGLTPPVTLSYSSDSVSEQHGPQGAAPWVGEGWNLALGSISWAEHNVTAGSGTDTWQDSWQLSDPYGTSAELIPPNLNISIFTDDTGHSITGTVTWHTAPETHAKVISYPGPLSLGGTTAPCFRVFLPNGIMEEFGCTSDSLQYYVQSSGSGVKYYISNWLLDLVTDRHGNQIHLTYQVDTETGAGGKSYPRDAQLATIEYDSPSCYGTTAVQTACSTSGTAPNKWAPNIRVQFQAAHTPARFYPGTGPTGNPCNTGSNLRCDDPLDLSGSGGLAAPNVQTTFVLNDIQVQVYASGAWNTLKDYQLSYEQSGPGKATDYTDPQTDKSESTAGMLDLTQLQEVGSDGTADPARIFGYTSVTEHYEDDAYRAPAGNCGPSWNATACLMWSESFAGNSRYLASASNGMGLAQTFSWAEGRNNTHGVNSGGSNTDPLYCNGLSQQQQGQYPCSQADDQSWSHAVLIQEQDEVIRLTQAGQGGQQTTTPVISQTSYSYKLAAFTANPCLDCTQGMYWGNQNDADYLDYYNGKFMGFTQATVTHPDGSVDVHQYYAGIGWGIYDAPLTPPNNLQCFSSNPCHADPWWDYHNSLHGREYQDSSYDTNGTTLLKKVQTAYSDTCPPSGVLGTGSTSWGNFDGNLVSELDHNNPVADCDIQTSQTDTYTYDGSSPSGAPHQSVNSVYDSYGRVTSQTTTSNDGGATSSPTTIVQTTAYVWNDTVNASTGQGTYLIDFPTFTDTEDSSGTRYSCTFTSYDGLAYETGSQTNFTGAGEVTSVDRDSTSCGTTPKNQIVTTSTYDNYGNKLTTDDADANAGNSAHLGCTVGTTTYSTCATFDSTFETLETSSANALNQTEQTGYTSQSDLFGFGLWSTSSTDVNGQTTTYGYDGLGRMTSRTLPGETSGLTTTIWSYSFAACSGTAAQAPCVEVDETQRLNSTTTITTRAFYDGFGRLVELRSPGPNGQDVVRYRYYDVSGQDVFESIQYFVSAWRTGDPTYSIPDSSQPGSSTTYDGLGRVTSKTDALSEKTNTSYSVVCNAISGDSACYEQGLVIDPLGHQQATLGDALGREIYDVRYTGNSPSTYAIYAITKYTYDYLGNLTQILQPDGTSKTIFQFDLAGRQTGLVDPDRGTESYAYDADGNRVQSTDARGSSGTVYSGYDGLDRQLWRNTTNSPTGAYVTYTYDSSASGNYGVGHMTGETFSGSGGLSGSYSYVYDARGQQISNTLTIGSASYPVQTTYDDAKNVLSQTYPDGEVVTNGYNAQGWLTDLSTQIGSSNVSLMRGAQYSGVGGAGHLITQATMGQATYIASYDLLLRLTQVQLHIYPPGGPQNGVPAFEETRSFDAVGNVTGQTTTIYQQGTDVQAFCYDEQNRLTWAGSVGTPPCTGIPITPGSLTAAQYSQTLAYDTLGRETYGTLGSYVYGDSAHLHAVTSTSGSAYQASYDAAGNMTCRSTSSTTTCAGTQTAPQLSYDNEGRLSHWQNLPTSPYETDDFLYDGEGNRVAQKTTNGSTVTTTTYVGNLEEVASSGSTTTVTTYYYVGGQRIALAVNGVVFYLASDAISSVSVALDTSGDVQASQLFYPHGGVRFSSGTMPGTYGFTGQRKDGMTGLDYYNARYYDPVAGQFISADTMLPGKGYDPWGLSRYAYVEGNPISRTDPSGHFFHSSCLDGEWCGGPPGGPGGTVGGGQCPNQQSGCSSGNGGRGPKNKGVGGGNNGDNGGTCRTDAGCDMGNTPPNGWRPCGPVADFCMTGNEDGNDAILSLDGLLTNQLTGQGAAGVAQLIAYLQAVLGGFLSGYIDSIYNQEVANISGVGLGGSVVGGIVAGVIGFFTCGPGCAGGAAAGAFGVGAGVTSFFANIVASQDKANAYNQMAGAIEGAISSLQTLEGRIQNGILPSDTVVTLNEEDWEQSDTPYPEVQLDAVIAGPNTPPEAGGVQSPYSGY